MSTADFLLYNSSSSVSQFTNRGSLWSIEY